MRAPPEPEDGVAAADWLRELTGRKHRREGQGGITTRWLSDRPGSVKLEKVANLLLEESDYSVKLKER